MQQKKITLADVLSLISILIFCFVCFLSVYFLTLGDLTQSLIKTAIIAVLLVGMAFGAGKLKRTIRNFKTCFVFEIIFLVLLTGLTVFFAIAPFSHFFVVSEQRTEVKDKLTLSITQAENLFEQYEAYAKNRETLYNSKLISVVAAKRTNPSGYATYGFVNNNISDSIQIDNKMFTVHADLFPTNYEDKKIESSNWTRKAKSTLNNWWDWNFGIVNVVINVESRSNEWLTTLVELSTIREQGEKAEDFAYSLSFDDAKQHFTTQGKPSLLSIGIAIGAYLLMLFTYLFSERSSKSPTFRRGKVKKSVFDVDF